MIPAQPLLFMIILEIVLPSSELRQKKRLTPIVQVTHSYQRPVISLDSGQIKLPVGPSSTIIKPRFPHMAGRRQHTVEVERKSQNLLWECVAPCMTAKGPGQGPAPYKSQLWKMEMMLKIKLNCTHKCLALGPWRWEREGDDLYSPGPALL